MTVVDAPHARDPDHAGGGVADVALALEVEPEAAAGGVVLATVRATAPRDVVLQGGAVTLTCSLAYRYTEGFFGAAYSATARRVPEVVTQPLPGPTLLRQGEVVALQVLLPVPAGGPPTIDAPLVTVAWAAGAVMRFEGTAYAEAEPRPVRVLADGRGADLAAAATVPGGRRPDRLSFEGLAVDGVARRLLRPGGRLTGHLVLEPRRSGAVEEARVELVLASLVPHGPWVVDDPSRNPEALPNEAEEVVVRSVLAHPGAPGSPAGAGAPGRPPAGHGATIWPFAIDAPTPLPAPTWVAPEFAVRWLLRGVVTRRRSRPTTASVELDASTRPR